MRSCSWCGRQLSTCVALRSEVLLVDNNIVLFLGDHQKTELLATGFMQHCWEVVCALLEKHTFSLPVHWAGVQWQEGSAAHLMFLQSLPSSISAESCIQPGWCRSGKPSRRNFLLAWPPCGWGVSLPTCPPFHLQPLCRAFLTNNPTWLFSRISFHSCLLTNTSSQHLNLICLLRKIVIISTLNQNTRLRHWLICFLADLW